jgi:hypothetical protein
LWSSNFLKRLAEDEKLNIGVPTYIPISF